MNRVWNFSAGPATLPVPVLQQAQAELLDWRGQGASVMELSHRGQPFMALVEEIEADLRRLAIIPASHAVLFLQGGATQHFAEIPVNLALPGASADYLVNGHWGEKAASEAAPYVNVRVAGRGRGEPCRSVAAVTDPDPHAAYLHYTPNETIHGIEFHDVPDAGDVPLVADMSSNILSGPIDISRFGLIYAGAQKNIGPSGLVLLVVRKDLLERPKRPMARIFNYAEHAAAHSMLNTPNTWGWYLAGLTFKWLLGEGGLEVIGARNRDKAAALYAAIDGSGGYYRNDVERPSRSRMNVPFVLHDKALDALFLAESQAAGMIGLKGHRVVGGMRASLYNAMPLAGVKALTEFMRDFARRHG